MESAAKTHELVSSFEEQLESFFSKEFISTTKSPGQDENLGQVFTSSILTNFMIGLLNDHANSTSSILDPCIGPNTFFKALPKDLAKCHLKGIEIDKSLINTETKEFYSHSNRSLILGSFFDLELSEKFDLIIQNPPYVRQELLASGVNSRENIKNELSEDVPMIPSLSNLYAYFLLKSILHLKKNGVMVAVIYDSWLYSSFGTFLKESLLKLGHLESVYHFKKSAFENAEVGATVIKFVKTSSKKSTSYYPLVDLNDLKTFNDLTNQHQVLTRTELVGHSFNNASILTVESDLFKSLNASVSQPIRRGTPAIVNDHFIFSKKTYPELSPIIKDVHKIKTYVVPKKNDFILALNGSISNSTRDYLYAVKNKILATPSSKYRTLKRELEINDEWYKIKPRSRGNFIFNYYLRNNVDFLYNPNKHLSSDNFYSLNIEHSELVHLAILNSSFTRLNVLNHSRNQGNGLRKIQLYEFREVKIIDVEKLSNHSSNELEKLGKSLMAANRYNNKQKKIIERIDSILLIEYNAHTNSSMSLEAVRTEIKEYLK